MKNGFVIFPLVHSTADTESKIDPDTKQVNTTNQNLYLFVMRYLNKVPQLNQRPIRTSECKLHRNSPFK